MNTTQREAVVSMCHRLLDTIRAANFDLCLGTLMSEEPLTEAQMTEVTVISLRTLADALEKVRRGHDDAATVRILREAVSFHEVDVDVTGEKRG